MKAVITALVTTQGQLTTILCMCCGSRVVVVAAFSKFLASMALKDVVQTLPAKIIYLENLMLEPMNCAMKTVA